MARYRWTKISDRAEFAPRDGAGSLVFKGRMWMLGGWNPNDEVHFPRICNSEVWSSTDGREWTRVLDSAPWEGRHTAGYVVHDGRMWLVGGDANQGHYQSDVWCSDNGRDWALVTAEVPWGPRALHHTIAFGGKMWVVGGQTVPQIARSGERRYSDVWSSVDGDDWVRVSDDLPWGPRGMIGGGIVFKDRMWLVGGGTYDTPAFPNRTMYNDVWSSADGVEWRCDLAAAPWRPRQYHDVAVFDGRMWVVAGYGKDRDSARNLNDVWWSDDGARWVQAPASPWAPRHASCLFVHGGKLWLVGGNNMTSDVWTLSRVEC